MCNESETIQKNVKLRKFQDFEIQVQGFSRTCCSFKYSEGHECRQTNPVFPPINVQNFWQ